MKILAADDEKTALNILERSIAEAVPDCELHCFSGASKAIADFRDGFFPDAAFLDIEMPGMNGLEMARQIKNISPQTNIIFVTGFSDYAVEAFGLRPSGYVMKPASKEKILCEINDLRHPARRDSKDRLQVQTFGNFEVFYNGAPVKFERSKAKEIFAYLVDKQGTTVTTAEIAAILWEYGAFDRSRQKQLQSIICSLQKSLAEVNCGDVIIKSKQGVMVDKSKFDCDLYSFMQGDIIAVNSYKGQYMYSYSWAEFTAGYLDNQIFE